MTARLTGWYSWRRIGSDAVECVQYADSTWYAAREEASRVCGVEAQGLVCERVPGPMTVIGYVGGAPLYVRDDGTLSLGKTLAVIDFEVGMVIT